MSRDFRFWSVEILWTVQSPHSRELTLAVPKLPIYVETIVPREPVRTTLRFAASAPLRSAPSGVRSGTHSWPNVSTGETLF